jgi:hypothetical protein
MRKLFLTIAAIVACTSSALAQAAADTEVLSYRDKAQALIKQLVEEGETDVDTLVSHISSEDAGKLDHIVINVATQTIYELNFADQVLGQSNVSTGRKGYDTPLGTYKIVNKASKAYSQKYDAWMLNWMGLTADGNYGIHGLEGSSYERHLGGVASHGCVRLSRKYAKDLFGRMKVGTPVRIINDKAFKPGKFEPLSRQAALSMVMEVLSPSNPWQIYY